MQEILHISLYVI